MAASSRRSGGFASWVLGVVVIAVPVVVTAPSLGGSELDPLAFVFGLALAGLLAGAALLVARLGATTWCVVRLVCVAVGAVAAGVTRRGVVGG